MLKRTLILLVLSFGVYGCSGNAVDTTIQNREITQYIGHLDKVEGSKVILRNPKNGHIKTFALSEKTVIEVDGIKAAKLPDPVKGDNRNCRITIDPGTVNAVKVEIKTN